MRILTCSNSCPRWEDGKIFPRSPGGLVPMVIALLDQHGGDWIFTLPPDRPGTPDTVRVGSDVVLHPIEPGEDLRRQHYDEVSIRLILGLLHYLHDTSEQPVFDDRMWAAWAGYEEVNRLYAKRLAEVSGGGDDELVLLNDPHLMLVPEFFAAERPGRRRLAYFLGTPWCEPDYFSLIPRPIRVRLLTSLLRCDVVGFHASRWADAFLRCCARELPGAVIDGRTVHHAGHRTELVATPFPLDTGTIDTMVAEPPMEKWRGRLAQAARGRRIMLRADRLDLWKNLPRGFRAYEMLLERRPELAAECWFAAVVTTPSRATGRHLAYAEATEEVVRRINERFAVEGTEAVSLVRPAADDDSRHCVLAGLGMSDAAVVNSTYDGLNLFAKEAAYVLPDNASLLISENAGVLENLSRFAVPVDPFDLAATSAAMEAALTGPGTSSREERRSMLRGETVSGWLAEVFRL
ncbi:trehalose-6-phosphate synthase [Amycolatopsis sp. H6(2020)]|nr:trehalose-6-phosphate synthase [Amycolatopsis sp. H6(2020)]